MLKMKFVGLIKIEHFKVCSESNLSVGAIAAISSSADNALVATNLDSRLDFFVISRLNVSQA